MISVAVFSNPHQILQHPDNIGGKQKERRWVRVFVWTGLEVGWLDSVGGLDEDGRNVRCTEALELCTWISLRRLALSSASQGLIVTQFLWEDRHDWLLNCVSGIRGDFVVVSVSMFGGFHSYFYGCFNDFRACGKIGFKWRTWSINICVLQQGGGESVMAHVENGFLLAQNIRKGVYGKYNSATDNMIWEIMPFLYCQP